MPRQIKADLVYLRLEPVAVPQHPPLGFEDGPDGRVQSRLLEPVGQPPVFHDGRHTGRRGLEILKKRRTRS